MGALRAAPDVSQNRRRRCDVTVVVLERTVFVGIVVRRALPINIRVNSVSVLRVTPAITGFYAQPALHVLPVPYTTHGLYKPLIAAR